MTRAPTLLLVDDDNVFRDTLAGQLRRSFPTVRTADSVRACRQELERAEPDVLLLDLCLDDGDGLDVLRGVREHVPSTEVIIVTGLGTVDAAVEAMREGAFDFVTKPLSLEGLVQTIRRASERRSLRRENAGLRRMLSRRPAPTLVGTSRAMEEVRKQARRAADSDAPVLIGGPSGCGKELVAWAIHVDSSRCGREMITVNCASLHDNLIESELFGHERGAFTGADEQRAGLMEAAHEGTLFLDEIGEFPLPLQAKLLRAIQFGEIRRVGGVSTLTVDVRIVAASNRDLEQAVRERKFREDLYYRLNVLSIEVPPLRERREDLEPILRGLAKRHGLAYELGPEHFEVLEAHAWPGNVRELENLVERLKIRETDGPPTAEGLRALIGPAKGRPTPGVRPLAEVERETIEAALQAFGGDREATARALGISVRTLYYRLASYGRA